MLPMSTRRVIRAFVSRRGSALGVTSGSAKPNCHKPELAAGSRPQTEIRGFANWTAAPPTANVPAAGGPQLRTSLRQFSSAALAQPVESDAEEYNNQQQQQQLSDRIGFIGAGQMGEALIRGFCASGISSADRLSASVRSAERQQRMTSLGVRAFGNALEGGAEELAANSDIIVLGVKPIYMQQILDALAPHVTSRHLVISIAAGIKIGTLQDALPDGTRVARVMPNTPCLIGQAASAYVLGTHTTEEDKDKVDALVSSVGMAVCVEEQMIDAVTGLSGSGPAYVFQMLEAMADGAVAAGLPRDKALALATQTVVGAARMVFESAGDGSMTHPGVLKDRVTSPAGTTITGLAELENSGVRGAYIRAIKAAANRSKELSQM